MFSTSTLAATLLASALLLCTLSSQATSKHCRVTLDQSDEANLLDHAQRAYAGDACAQFNMSYRFYTQQRYAESKSWYAKAADQGVSRAAFEIAILYRDKLLPGDDSERKRWLAQAAEQGLSLAQVELGIDYLYNPGDQDERFQAMYWFEQAAQSNYAPAQFSLSEAYSTGSGTPVNRSSSNCGWSWLPVTAVMRPRNVWITAICPGTPA